MKRKYAWNKDIINYKTPIFASWQWKKLLAHRTVFVQGLRWTIGNGQSIKFWSDNWVFQFPLISKFTPTVGSEDLKVSECILESGVWDYGKLLTLVPPYISKIISSLFIPLSPQNDKLVWGLTSDGEYSVKSGADLIQSSSGINSQKVEYN